MLKKYLEQKKVLFKFIKERKNGWVENNKLALKT